MHGLKCKVAKHQERAYYGSFHFFSRKKIRLLFELSTLSIQHFMAVKPIQYIGKMIG